MDSKIRIWKARKDEQFYGMWRVHCPLHRSFQYWDFGASLGATLEHLRREHRPLPVDPDRCGGVSINGQPPKCCEVHMAPWGHPKGIPVWGRQT